MTFRQTLDRHLGTIRARNLADLMDTVSPSGLSLVMSDGRLVRSTLAAYLRPGHSLFDRIADRVEKAWSKTFFARSFGRGGLAAAGSVRLGMVDHALVAVTAPFIMGRFLLLARITRGGRLSRLGDAYVLRLMRKRLQTYGVEEAMTEAHGQMAG